MLQDAINLRVTSSDVESQIAASIEMCVKTDENGVVQSEIAMTANRVSIDSTNFKLTKAGKITATSGTIGGWTITSSSLYIKDGNDDIITKLSNDGKITSGTSKDNQVIVENGHLDFYYGGTRSFRLGQTADNGFSLEDKNNNPRFAVYPITQWGNSNISSDYRTVVAASGGFVITANYGNNALVLEGASVRLCGDVTAYNNITAKANVSATYFNATGETGYQHNGAIISRFYNESIYDIIGAGDKTKYSTACFGSDSKRTHIRGTSVYIKSVNAENYSVSSTEEIKTNISSAVDALSLFANNKSEIYMYNLKPKKYNTVANYLENKIENGIPEDILQTAPNENSQTVVSDNATYYGFVIGDGYKTPQEVISEDGQHINLYSMASINWLATKELYARLQELEERIL